MRAVIVLVALLSAACGSSPTAPTAPPVVPPVIVVPPPVPIAQMISVTPCPTSGPPDLAFYLQIGCNGFDLPMQPVRRWTVAPKVYLKTVDEAGAPIDVFTLDTVQNAMIDVAPRLTGGKFGLEGVLRGSETREGASGWITVKWPATAESFCGQSDVGRDGGVIELSYKTANCSCNGSAIRPRTARHELGHALGYWHTQNADDLMSNPTTKPCDQQPSTRELQAAAFQYR